jgi:Skp family chaperone for outer membrane proteins
MNKFYKLGWLFAAAFGGILLAGGFQDPQMKIAVVDLGKIIDTSEVSKDGTAKLQAAKRAREDFLTFLDTYKVASSEQIIKLKDLSLKPTLTAAEKTELDAIKADILKTDEKYKGFLQKKDLSADEQTLFNDYTARARASEMTVERLFKEFDNDWQNQVRDQTQQVVEKARLSVSEVAKAGGYSLVFDVRVTPYGANDLTDASMKAMNAKK